MISLVLAIVLALIAILLCIEATRTKSKFDINGLPGLSFDWHLTGDRKTEVISNKRLGAIQRYHDKGGLVKKHDQIVVWAREFLDDDVLYEDVLYNVKHGVAYFYILDREHIHRFKRLLDKLYAALEESVVNDRINVIFVRPELTLNNFVIISYGTDREIAYSSLIFDRRPFGWIQQEFTRAKIIMDRIELLVAGVALAQAAPTQYRPVGPFAYFDIDDQIMDFSEHGRLLLSRGMNTPEKSSFSLRQVVSQVLLPDDTQVQVQLIEERQRHLRAVND